MNTVLKKFAILKTLVLAIVFTISIITLSLIVKDQILTDIKGDFTNRINDVKSSFEVLNESIKISAKSSAEILENKFDYMQIERDKFAFVNGVNTNVLTLNDEVVNGNNMLMDEFTNVTGAVATIFVKHNNDFYRVATSLTQNNGLRAIGTYLGKEHPAFNVIMNKKEYIGKATLFGKNYMTVYKPVIQDDEVVAILFVGYNFDGLYSILEEKLKNIKFGDTGFVYTINTKTSTFTLHPTLKDKKLEEVKDDFYNEIIKEKTGVKIHNSNGIDYISSYTELKEWDIIISSDTKLNEVLALNKSINNYLIFGGFLLLFVLLTLNYFIIQKVINKPLFAINNGLNHFFKYLNRQSNMIEEIKLNTNDEFGQMAKVLNENIEKTKISIEDDRKFIDETVKVLSILEKGDLSQRLNINVSNDSLMKLKEVINNMGINLESKINDILKILDQYSKYNYMNKISTNGTQAHILELSNGVNILGDAITNMLIENKSNGLTLDHSSNILLTSVDQLNVSSNSAAASLEQTAAALEEITANVRNNTENIAKMVKFSNEVTNSSKKGEDLANETTVAMDQINNQVKFINEAISIIDNISFQTNILSLNAAVEAATAGEAGKGFAVVAQEVRNLANRSAEAAKEIKELVEEATKKANDGKNIANQMINGYKMLNENINNTITLIHNVEISSKEQLTGIEQINDAINLLDQQTQQNASIASQAHDVAITTDKIAKLVVSNANAKQFVGKDTVKPKENIETKNIIKKDLTVKKTNNQTTIIKSSIKEENDWDSF